MKSHYSENEENEIDENTRDLIRARLSVIQFKKREIRKARKDKALGVFKKWREIAQHRKKDRDTALNSQRPEENADVVINIDKIDTNKTKENGIIENGDSKINENGSPRRFPFFTQNKTANGGVKPQMDSLRVTSSNKVNLGQQELPVARGRPVSSKPRVSPNVTLTDVETKGGTMRSVHFEGESDANKGNTDTDKKIKINSVVPTNGEPVSKSKSDKVSTDNVGIHSENNNKPKEKT
jgi:hypothetical protein